MARGVQQGVNGGCACYPFKVSKPGTARLRGYQKAVNIRSYACQHLCAGVQRSLGHACMVFSSPVLKHGPGDCCSGEQENKEACLGMGASCMAYEAWHTRHGTRDRTMGRQQARGLPESPPCIPKPAMLAPLVGQRLVGEGQRHGGAAQMLQRVRLGAGEGAWYCGGGCGSGSQGTYTQVRAAPLPASKGHTLLKLHFKLLCR